MCSHVTLHSKRWKTKPREVKETALCDPQGLLQQQTRSGLLKVAPVLDQPSHHSGSGLPRATDMSAQDMTLLLPDSPLCPVLPDRGPYVLLSTSTRVYQQPTFQEDQVSTQTNGLQPGAL